MSTKITKPTCLDLFCGAGGLSKGFESAGYNVLAGIDFWKDALVSYAANHKHSKVIQADKISEHSAGAMQVFAVTRSLGTTSDASGQLKLFGIVAELGMPYCRHYRTVGVSPTGVVTVDRLSSPCQRQSARRRRYGLGCLASPTLRHYQLFWR